MDMTIFDRLEEGVGRALETIEHGQLEREKLMQQITALEHKLTECQSAFSTLTAEHAQVKQVYEEHAEWIAKKDEIKERVERLLTKLDAAQVS